MRNEITYDIKGTVNRFHKVWFCEEENQYYMMAQAIVFDGKAMTGLVEIESGSTIYHDGKALDVYVSGGYPMIVAEGEYI